MKHRALFVTLLGALALSAGAQDLAQATCHSDGAAPPTALMERFLPADCTACWRRREPPPPASAVALDWIVPAGDTAAMASAAAREATERLQALRLAPAAHLQRHNVRVHAMPGARLRVGRGPVLGGYAGASITLTLPPQARPALPLTAWLVLVENVTAGTEGTPVPRRLARNALVLDWTDTPDSGRWHESRPLDVPDNAGPQRLSVLGWVQDARGRVIAAARARCR